MRGIIVCFLLMATLVLTWHFWLTPSTIVEHAIMMSKAVPGLESWKTEKPPVVPAIKKELSDLLDIAGKASPLATLVLAFMARKKKRFRRFFIMKNPIL